MDDVYKIFVEESYNKILDLVENVDTKLIKKYQQVLKFLPNKIIKALGTGDDFEMFSKDFDADLLNSGDDSIFFTFKDYKKDLKIELNIIPFYEEDLEDDYKPVFVFSLSLTVNNNRGLDWEVYIQPNEEDCQLICIQNLNGEMANQKVINISYSELLEYANTEEYVDDTEEDPLDDKTDYYTP